MSGYEHTAKFLMETTAERDKYRDHTKRLADAIQGLRNIKELKMNKDIRRTPAFAEMCEAWRAYAEAFGIRENPNAAAPDKWSTEL